MLKSYWIHILYLWIVTAGSSFCSWVMYSTLESMCRAQVAWSGCDLFSCLSRSFYLNALEHGLKLSHDLFRIAGIQGRGGLGRLLFELFTLTLTPLKMSIAIGCTIRMWALLALEAPIPLKLCVAWCDFFIPLNAESTQEFLLFRILKIPHRAAIGIFSGYVSILFVLEAYRNTLDAESICNHQGVRVVVHLICSESTYSFQGVICLLQVILSNHVLCMHDVKELIVLVVS